MSVMESIPGPVKSDTVWPTSRHRYTAILQSCIAQAISRGDGPDTRYRLRRNTASIVKIRVFLEIEIGVK